MCKFSGKTDNFVFLNLNLPKNWSEFQKSKSRFGISISKIPWEPIFSQDGQLLFFRPKFREFAQLRAIFGSNNVRELGGGWDELVEGGWSKVEVGASGWKWVQGLVIPFLYSTMNKLLKLFGFWLAPCRSSLHRYV